MNNLLQLLASPEILELCTLRLLCITDTEKG